MEVIRQWAGKAPTDAATWVLNLPAGDARRAGIEAVASRWLETDSTAAFAWLAASTNQSVRAEISRAMAQALAAQPGFIREGLLGNADASIRDTLEQQVKQIAEQAAKDNSFEPKFRLPEPCLELSRNQRCLVENDLAHFISPERCGATALKILRALCVLLLKKRATGFEQKVAKVAKVAKGFRGQKPSIFASFASFGHQPQASQLKPHRK